MPILKDLNGLIPDGIGSEYAKLKNYCQWLRDICRGDSECLKMESIATNILSAQIFSMERERLYNAELRFELLHFIAASMKRTSLLSAESSQILSRFLESVANDRKSAERNLLLSFNYDMLVEDQVKRDPHLFLTAEVDYGVQMERADCSSEHLRRQRSIDLLKLHGSLNWYPVKGAGEEFNLNSVCRVEAGDGSFPLYKEDNPIFIPMAHAKESFLKGSLFNVIWAKADYWLSHAKEIYIIGYGFPQTDGNSLPFLLKHRERIRKVVVFEKTGDASLGRLERLFDKDVVVCEDAKIFLKDWILHREA